MAAALKFMKIFASIPLLEQVSSWVSLLSILCTYLAGDWARRIPAGCGVVVMMPLDVAIEIPTSLSLVV